MILQLEAISNHVEIETFAKCEAKRIGTHFINDQVNDARAGMIYNLWKLLCKTAFYENLDYPSYTPTQWLELLSNLKHWVSFKWLNNGAQAGMILFCFQPKCLQSELHILPTSQISARAMIAKSIPFMIIKSTKKVGHSINTRTFTPDPQPKNASQCEIFEGDERQRH